jgi:hypothetical protein
MDPRNASAHSSLGAALMTKGNTTEGLKHLREAKEIDPLIPDPAEMEITFQLKSYYRQQFDEAIKNSNCKGAASFAHELDSTMQDNEVAKAIKDCDAKH